MACWLQDLLASPEMMAVKKAVQGEPDILSAAGKYMQEIDFWRTVPEEVCSQVKLHEIGLCALMERFLNQSETTATCENE